MDEARLGAETFEIAARLATNLQAELRGLFVETEDLLRLAAMPFACEVAYSTAPRQLDEATMQRTLRARAEQAKQAVAEIAQRLSIPWTFEIARGQMATTALRAPRVGDTLVVGFETRAGQHLLYAGWRMSGKRTRPISVLDDGGPSSRKALAIAAQMALEQATSVVVLGTMANTEQGDDILHGSLDLLCELGVDATAHQALITDAGSAVVAARVLRSCLLLAGRDNQLLGEPSMRTFLHQLDCPFAIV
jgi:hypothetical protein